MERTWSLTYDHGGHRMVKGEHNVDTNEGKLGLGSEFCCITVAGLLIDGDHGTSLSTHACSGNEINLLFNTF